MSLRRRTKAGVEILKNDPATSAGSSCVSEYQPLLSTKAVSALRKLTLSIFVLVCILTWAFWSRPRSKPPSSVWLVSTARSNITPATPMWLSGFSSRTRLPSSVEVERSDDLFVRVVSFKDSRLETPPFILVSLDLIGGNADFSQRIFDAAKDELGVERAYLKLCFSHTHSGPVVGEHLFPLVPDHINVSAESVLYVDGLVRTIVDAVARTLDPETLRLATAHSATGSCTLAVNRREIEETAFDGEQRGTVDDSVTVLWFVAEPKALESPHAQQEVLAGIFGYSAHASVITSGYTYSPDYPGFATSALESSGGPGGVWLFVAGAGGDQNVYPRGTRDLAVSHGYHLASSVEKVLKDGSNTVLFEGLTSSASSMLSELPYKATRTLKELRHLKREGDEPTRKMARHWIHHLIAQPRKKDTLAATPSSYPVYPVCVWQVGRIRIAFLGGEPTAGYKQLIQGASNVHWIIGYTDDVMGYVGTRDVLLQGGREGSDRAAAYYGLPSVWDLAVEDVILRVVQNLSHAVHPDPDEKVLGPQGNIATERRQ